MSSALSKPAERVDTAALNASAIEQLTRRHPFSVEDAYEIQRLSIERRYARGEQLCGVKMGFTSRLKMQQMGVDEMIWGRLTDAMRIAPQSAINLAAYIHPRAEPEIAFLMKKSITGPVSPAQAMSAVEAVAPAIEIIDSRYENFKFSLPDVIADNCSSAGFVTGSWSSPKVDIANLGMVFSFNDDIVSVGSSAAILGHPLQSLLAAARLLGNAGLSLQAGWVVLAGASTAAQALRGQLNVQVEVEKLGSVSFKAD